jgi:hypothetical protein
VSDDKQENDCGCNTLPEYGDRGGDGGDADVACPADRRERAGDESAAAYEEGVKQEKKQEKKELKHNEKSDKAARKSEKHEDKAAYEQEKSANEAAKANQAAQQPQ